jgi:hypothetical protein
VRVGDLGVWPDRNDPLAVNQNRRIVERLRPCAIDQKSYANPFHSR